MSGIRRSFLIASVCMAYALAGCVQVAPSPPGAAATTMPDPTATMIAPPATPIPEPTVTPPAVAAPWQVFVDGARGLSVSYPPGWIFIDPTEDDLAVLLAKMGEQANSDAIRELLPTLTSAAQQQEDLFVGIGFQYALAPDALYANNLTVISVAADDLPLHLFAQLVAAQLNRIEGIDVESAGVVAGLRPQGGEAASIHYRADGALYNLPGQALVGWQVGILSPNAETIVVLTFGIRGEDFAVLEPLLVEIVQRVQWEE
jgi:hypothetical protein